MDRVTVYPGQVPKETDLLSAQQYAMVGLAEFCFTVLGSPTLVDAFTCTPTSPASLNVLINPGNIYQMENLEATTWSSLPADTAHTVMKQGILLDPVSLAITPPATFGYSQVYLLEVQYQDIDANPVVLPYYNAANPAVPFAGSGDLGAAQNTARKGAVGVQLKAGIPAPTGSQTTPGADPGWTGIYTITVANGASTIIAANIARITTAPYLATLGHLPQIPNGVQNWQWSYTADSGTTNAWVGAVAPLPLGLTPGLSIRIKVANAITGATTFNLNSLGAIAVHRANGAALQSGDVNANMVVDLVYDGSAWQVVNFEGFTSSTTNNNTYLFSIPYCVDASTTPNQINAPFTPQITALHPGTTIEVKVANTNTGDTHIAVNQLSNVQIVDKFGNALASQAVAQGEVVLLIYDGTHFQIVNGSGGGTGNGALFINGQSYTVHGTYTFTVPAGIYSLWVRVVGAGGSFNNLGDEGADIRNLHDDPGGGAGGYAEGIVAVTPGQQIPVTVGLAGSIADTRAQTVTGGSSSFGAFLSATGGVGGVDQINDSAAGLGNVLGGTGTGGSIINFSGGVGMFHGRGGAGVFGRFPASGAGAQGTIGTSGNQNAPGQGSNAGTDGAVIIVW